MNPKVIIYLLFSLFVLLVTWEEQSSLAVASHHQEVSKEDAIRLRILANSDSVSDQALKREIRDQVNVAITEWVTDIRDLNEARATIKRKIPQIEQIVSLKLAELGIDQSYQVRFSEIEFPTRLYGNLVYPAGVYESIVITLGSGEGENWWCVLFPPLCFLDMASGKTIDEANTSDQEDPSEDNIEVSFFIVELFSKFADRFFP